MDYNWCHVCWSILEGCCQNATLFATVTTLEAQNVSGSPMRDVCGGGEEAGMGYVCQDDYFCTAWNIFEKHAGHGYKVNMFNP